MRYSSPFLVVMEKEYVIIREFDKKTLLASYYEAFQAQTTYVL